MFSWVKNFDDALIRMMRRFSISMMRVALGIVFFWFGALKVLGVSPVAGLVQHTYSFFPEFSFLIFLGVWEMVIGLGLLLNIWLRVILALLWLQMAGTLFASILAPSVFFLNGNPFFLTTEGEFVVKNIVLIAASIVIGGYGVKNLGGKAD